jgi:hypothetical protein
MPNGNQWSPTAGTRGKELTGRFDWAAGKAAGERWMPGVSFLISPIISLPLSCLRMESKGRTDTDCGFRLAVTFLVFPLPG